ncbi:hypothetical protein LFYK43_16310 [Ligilactobacillus salitolerans]|uniref:DUF1310 domain-containing protein n=1 Tax=Ligilactobacillus salitolerans TaxID=1808352 RepID=A0A401IUG4_9LACO|nr:DUF1310 family protein [Ligilactobacillus salitolerans]GBG95172.1 hypothetical protein LFYK43_16310 [Ligilactobacillus salitolerans]
MKKKTKIILSSIIMVVVLIFGVIAGGKYYLNQKEEQQHEEMVSYVKKYHSVIEDDLRESDKKNFIKKITIDYSSVEHNPMGGIDVEGYVNSDKSLRFDTNIDKVSVDGKIKVESTNMGISTKLDDLLGDW